MFHVITPTIRSLIRLIPGVASVRRPLMAGIALYLSAVSANAAPLTEATVTRLQNVVSYGSAKGGKIRPAVVADVVRSDNFLLTETDSRAELKYADGSLVRIGQNTVFSFDASSRTLALEKGTFIFYVPKGSGGGTIKTPSLTAAITGTVGKVSENIIAIIEGEVTLIPSGRVVRAGFFARWNPDGTITIARFDPRGVWEGKLVHFNGPMPGVEEEYGPSRGLAGASGSGGLPPLDTSAIRTFDVLNRTSATPGAIEKFFPKPPSPPSPEPEPEVTTVAPPAPTPLPPPRPPPPPLRD